VTITDKEASDEAKGTVEVDFSLSQHLAKSWRATGIEIDVSIHVYYLYSSSSKFDNCGAIISHKKV